MAALAPKTFHLGDGHARNADIGQRGTHVVELERFNDRGDQFHLRALRRMSNALFIESISSGRRTGGRRTGISRQERICSFHATRWIRCNWLTSGPVLHIRNELCTILARPFLAVARRWCGESPLS